MLTKVFGLMIMIAPFCNAWAQVPDSVTKAVPPIRYYNSLLAGCVIGNEGTGTGASVITYHGIRVKRFAVAAGIGIDDYKRWRTMPLQLRISYDIAHWRGTTFFIAGAFGHAQSWRQVNDYMDYYYGEYRSSGGRTVNPCVGFRAGNKKLKFYAEVGYKHQRVNWSSTPTYYYMDFIAGGGGTRYTVEEDIDRFHVMVGLGLF
jgi:hypothetical protein